MRKNIQYKYFLPLVILVISMLLQGCKDDVFNPEKVKAAYQDKFPVKNINPEKPDVPLNKNDAFQKVQKRRVQEKR